MARLDAHTEYIISQEAYRNALASLPPTGTDHQKAATTAILALQYRQKTGDSINAGKWSMWGIAPEVFEFEWQNGAWQPPANLVVRAQ